jgi:hypothetical protein
MLCWRQRVARASSPQGLDISCDILSGGAAERQIRHLGVRIEQEIRQPLGVEIWRPRNRYERRRIGVSTGLIRRHYMTGSAPPFGKIAAMLGIGRVTSRRSKKEGGCGKRKRFAKSHDDLPSRNDDSGPFRRLLANPIHYPSMEKEHHREPFDEDGDCGHLHCL